MEILSIIETKSTPKVEFNPLTHKLLLRGQSYPENAFAFYEPIFAWIDDYFNQVKASTEVNLLINLTYFNTSSSKCIMMLLDKLEKEFKSGKQIVVNWYYDRENESALEAGEEYKEDLTIPFNIISIDKKEA